ncbi:MAG: VacJ family lipoprotein [Pseudomonadota bacterium]
MVSYAPRRSCTRVVALVLLVGSIGAPAAIAEQSEDPFEPVNRDIYAFNDAMDRWLLRPVAKGYDRVTPDPVQRSIGNVFDNLTTPGVALNQFLQGKPRKGLAGLGRFFVNSTLGAAGLFDIASRHGLPREQEDFGQTFQVWGAGRGPFLMLPFRGPANTTHAVGMLFDAFTNPVMLISPGRDRAITMAVDLVDTRADLLSAEELMSGDRYLFIRDAYRQRREYLVNDGAVESDPFLDDDF